MADESPKAQIPGGKAAANFPCASRRGPSVGSRLNRKDADELVVVEDLEEMLVRVYENFTRCECRILRNFSLFEFFNLKGQDIRYLESVARLKMFPIFAGIQFLDERLGGMIAFRHKFQQRRVRQPFQSRLLSMTAWN